MNENNYQNGIQDYQEDEIDIIELIAKLWTKRRFIIMAGVTGAVLGLVFAFSSPKKYSSKVILAPESEQKMGSGVSSIASMMGVNIDNSVDAIHFDMFPDVVASTPFLFNLLDMPLCFERNDEVIRTNLFEYMSEYQKHSWMSALAGLPFKALGWLRDLIGGKEEEPELGLDELDIYNLPLKKREVIKALGELLVVSVDKKSGKTEISAQMQDPQVVADVVKRVMDDLRDYMVDYRTSKSRQDVAYLEEIYSMRQEDYYRAQQAYAKCIDASKNVVLRSAMAEQERLQQEMNLAYQVYSQVASQLEAARIKVLEAKPVFAVLEPAQIPAKASFPSKLKMMVLVAFLAVCCAGAWALFGESVSESVTRIIGNDGDKS